LIRGHLVSEPSPHVQLGREASIEKRMALRTMPALSISVPAQSDIAELSYIGNLIYAIVHT
jgi:hypothetical protein